MTQQPHWEQYLVQGFAAGQRTPVTIEIDPASDHAGMVLVASRIAGLVDALKQRDAGAGDPLHTENTADLHRLLDHLHRVIATLTGQEDRLINVLRQRGESARSIAAAMEVNHRTVANRYKRIDRAAETGLNSLAYSETKTTELMDIDDSDV